MCPVCLRLYEQNRLPVGNHQMNKPGVCLCAGDYQWDIMQLNLRDCWWKENATVHASMSSIADIAYYYGMLWRCWGSADGTCSEKISFTACFWKIVEICKWCLVRHLQRFSKNIWICLFRTVSAAEKWYLLNNTGEGPVCTQVICNLLAGGVIISSVSEMYKRPSLNTAHCVTATQISTTLPGETNSSIAGEYLQLLLLAFIHTL